MLQLSKLNKLPPQFFTNDLLEIAKNLLGKIFVKQENEVTLAGKIVEVEAYDGKNDEAAHSFIGKTKRNEVMFRQGGILYVYFTYGVHYCCNVVTGNEGHGAAVLLRAIEPISGIELMLKNRFGESHVKKELREVANGPGKICKAFNINLNDNGVDLKGDKIFLLDQPVLTKKEIVQTTRVGITKSVELPWRFYIKDNKYISRK